MNELTHAFIEGIRDGSIRFTPEGERWIERQLYTGFRYIRPNSKIQLGEKGCEELRIALLDFLTRVA